MDSTAEPLKTDIFRSCPKQRLALIAAAFIDNVD
jgi:hypothetical protein